MLAGIAFQLAAIVVYVALASEFFVRWALDQPLRYVPAEDVRVKVAEAESGFSRSSTTSHVSQVSHTTLAGEATPTKATKNNEGLNRRAKIMIAGLTFSTICILIRSVYRVVELSEGWNGKIITTQRYYSEPSPLSSSRQ
jgi:hypothetical protein